MEPSNSLPVETYRNTLLVRLINFFPDLAQDAEFVERRSLLAAKEFQTVILSEGSSFADADTAANEILFSGLVFSPFATIKEVINSSFEDMIPFEDRQEKALKLLPLCVDIFNKYPTNDDYFESSVEFDTQLVPELVRFIENKL